MTDSLRLPIYLDHHATTPVDSEVLKEMLPFFSDQYGNAASIDHLYGNAAKSAVEQARAKVAKSINARPEEIVFTSGATEANNLAILGLAKKQVNRGHIITSVIEHPAVLDTCKYLEEKGWELTYLPVGKSGIIASDQVRGAIREDTVLISVMAANNEIGTLQPIEEIGPIAREHGIIFHTDATQAVGGIQLDVQEMQIDLLSLSSHKIYGPKGVGALYVRKMRPRVQLETIMHGGGHERGMRSGTLNVPGIVGLGVATEIARNNLSQNSDRYRELRDLLFDGLSSSINDVNLNGHRTLRLTNNLNIQIEGVEARALLIRLKKDLAISTGSACSTASVEPSHVILALGYGEERAHQSIRFGIGRGNTSDEIDFVVRRIAEEVRMLKRIFS